MLRSYQIGRGEVDCSQSFQGGSRAFQAGSAKQRAPFDALHAFLVVFRTPKMYVLRGRNNTVACWAGHENGAVAPKGLVSHLLENKRR